MRLRLTVTNILSISKTAPINTGIQTFLNRLHQLNLDPIGRKISHPSGEGWSQAATEMAIANYCRFLYLIFLYPEVSLVPTLEIDTVWHAHVLSTRKYATDMQYLFGEFLHHDPAFGTRGDEDHQRWQTAFQVTKALFQEHFGAEAWDEMTEDPGACEPLGF